MSCGCPCGTRFWSERHKSARRSGVRLARRSRLVRLPVRSARVSATDVARDAPLGLAAQIAVLVLGVMVLVPEEGCAEGALGVIW